MLIFGRASWVSSASLLFCALGAFSVPACSGETASSVGSDAGDGGTTSDAGGDDGASHEGGGPAIPHFDSVNTTFDDGNIVVEKVTYHSQGLSIFGQVCRPKDNARHKVLVSNHGGFSGLGTEWNGQPCKDAAKNGWVEVESSYRGEDGSDGKIEVCLGEVDDVLALITDTMVQPYADPSKVAMLGASHGGCITTRAVQRGAPVVAAVDWFGPTDWSADYRMWKSQLQADAGGAAGGAVYTSLATTLETATGGTPDTVPAEYDKRSPIKFMSDLNAFAHPFMALHGTADPLVVVSDTCRLAEAFTGVHAFHFDGTNQPSPSVPAGCSASTVTWLTGPRPSPTWPDSRYVTIYDGVGHNFDGQEGQAMLADALTFLVAKVP